MIHRPQADLRDPMRQAEAQFPILEQMIAIIEQVIAKQALPEDHPYFMQRLAWLWEIVDGK